MSLRLPDVEAASAAVVLPDAPRVVALEPYDAADAALALMPRGEEAVEVLFFDDTLDALGLPRGRFEESAADPWARELPPPRVAFTSAADAGWSALPVQRIVPFRLAHESPIACALRGGCFVDRGARDCTVPCPAPESPSAPTPPQPPVYQPCPAGWSEDPAAFACRPFADDAPPCPAGSLRHPGEATCHAPALACAAGWPDGLDDARTAFVRVGEVGGDGSRAAPWGRIEDALATAAPVIALAPGAHPAPPRLTGARRLIGTCAADTELRAPAGLVIGGGLAVEALAVSGPPPSVEGELTVERAELRVGLTLAADAVVRLHESVLDGGADVALRLGAGGRAVIEASRIVSAAVAIAAPGPAAIDATDSAIEGRLGAITATSAAIVLRASRLRSDAARALALVAGTLDADAVELRTTGGHRALAAARGTALTARRLVVTGVTGGIVLTGGTRATIDDSRFDDTQGDPRMITVDDAQLTLRRIKMGLRYALAVDSDGLGAMVTIEDLEVPLGSLGSINLVAGLGVALRRVSLVSSIDLSAYDPRGTTRPWDVEVDDMSVQNGVVRLRGAGRVRIARLHSIDPEGAGLVSRAVPRAPGVDVTDVRIERPRPQLDCGNDAACSGAAIYVENGDFALRRFRLEDPLGAAVTIQDTSGATTLSQGAIVGAKVAVSLGPAIERQVLRDLMVGVRLSDVERVCEPCGR